MTKSAESAIVVLGNTKTKTRVRTSEVKRYCFTLNNWSDAELSSIAETADKNNINYVIGKEKGEEGTPHLQGYVNLPVKKSMTSIIKLFDNKRIHWEPCKGSEAQNITYCTKDGDFRTNIKTLKPKKPIKIITELRPWQLEIEQLLNTEPDGRTINWYYESMGGIGKSSFCKYMYVKHKVLVIQGGKLADIMNMIFNTDMDDVTMIIIDIPRVNKNKVSYASIECILNGMITNTKYETGTKVFNPPHVIVFSNYAPDIDDTLSADRWKVINLRQEENVLDVIV